MRLLHVSDIHFRSPDCLTPQLDPERPYRTRLLQDVRTRVTAAPVDVLLVGGDIAFKGDPDEFQAANDWLHQLAEVAGCPSDRVYVVPGNHDVDRSVAGRTPAIRNAQQAIANAPQERRERELRTQFSDPDTGRALLAPLAAYNDFAKVFGCQIYPPDGLYWTQNLPLGGDVELRIHGLTSTILSGMPDRVDSRQSLYLSPLQTVLDPADDVVNLVICHHPPDWFMDQDEVDEAVCARAPIQLFGHKHRQRMQKDDGYVRFSAGAVNPERNEPQWSPGYNLIDISVQGEGENRAIHIAATLLEWQSNPDRFREKMPQGNAGTVFEHRIAFPGAHRPAHRQAPVAACTVVGHAEIVMDGQQETASAESTMVGPNTRNLLFRFWNLTTSQRREICLALSLISRDELALPEPERYGRAIRRAGEKGLMTRLAEEITKRES